MPVAHHTLLDFTGLVKHAMEMGAICVIVRSRTLEQQCQLEGHETWCLCPPLFSVQRCSGCNSQHVSSRPQELPHSQDSPWLRSRGGSAPPGPAPGLTEDSCCMRVLAPRGLTRPLPRHMGTARTVFEGAWDGCVCALMRPRGVASQPSPRALCT